MKLLTLNTHSLAEAKYEIKLCSFVGAVVRELPDVIAMQEVNQSCAAAPFDEAWLDKMVPCGKNVTVRSDNHAARTAQMLGRAGVPYHWIWIPIKIGYGKYDEGLAIFSRKPIIETDIFLISACDDYNNWKTRKILGIKTVDGDWFYTVHMGWWKDEDEPFEEQWRRMDAHLASRENVWLLGDFNSRADVKGEGYDCILASGWKDTYLLAKEKGSGITVGERIDGWRDKNKDAKEMRIDYIFTKKDAVIDSSEVIFNGTREPVISDHYGLMVTVKDEK